MKAPEGKPAPREPSRRAAVIGLIFVIVLCLAAWLLAHVLNGASQLQDCALSGRTNCAPIDSGSRD